MKYYFGKVPAQDVAMFGEDDLFENEGSYFYNAIEVGSNPGGMEDFVIYDTCGRSIPLSTDTINILAQVLLDIKLTVAQIQEAEAIQQDLEDADVIVTFE